MRQQAASYAQVPFGAGWHEASLLKQEALIIQDNEINITTGRRLPWRGDNLGLTQVPEQKSHCRPFSGTTRNTFPSSVEKRGDPRFV